MPREKDEQTCLCCIDREMNFPSKLNPMDLMVFLEKFFCLIVVSTGLPGKWNFKEFTFFSVRQILGLLAAKMELVQEGKGCSHVEELRETCVGGKGRRGWTFG